jgi:hypothetical protein
MLILQSVIDKERRGDYLGKTVQVSFGCQSRESLLFYSDGKAAILLQ